MAFPRQQFVHKEFIFKTTELYFGGVHTLRNYLRQWDHKKKIYSEAVDLNAIMAHMHEAANNSSQNLKPSQGLDTQITQWGGILWLDYCLSSRRWEKLKAMSVWQLTYIMNETKEVLSKASLPLSGCVGSILTTEDGFNLRKTRHQNQKNTKHWA